MTNPNKLLSRLIEVDILVPELQRELQKRDVPTKGLLKAELIEKLRQTIESELIATPGRKDTLLKLAGLRNKEISCLDGYKKKVLIVRCECRGLSKSGGEARLRDRLKTALGDERREFIDQHTQQEIEKQVPEALARWKAVAYGPEQVAEEVREKKAKAALVTANNEIQGGVDHQKKSAANIGQIPSSKSPSKHVLTNDERRRMEENRKHALKRKEEAARRKKKLCTLSSPTRTLHQPSSSATSNTSTPAKPSISSPVANPYAKKPCCSTPSNPYKKKILANIASTATSTTRTFSNTSTSNMAQHHPAANMDVDDDMPPLAAQLGAPPRSSSTAVATPQKSVARAPPCSRCGLDYDELSLCIVWTHKGDIHRERGYYGKQFRYDCCGKLDPSPCFIGRHTRNPTAIKFTVSCNCGRMAQVRRTKKEGNNKHRLFFTCGDDDRSCNFFRWCDEAFNLPPKRSPRSFDGVDEYRYPHANPFGERLGPGALSETTSVYQQRKRLVAAVLVNSILYNVSGETGFVTGSCILEQLWAGRSLGHVICPFECWRKGNIAQALRPLTTEQIANRFGKVNGQPFPSLEECEKMLLEMLECGNPIIRTTVSTDIYRNTRFVDMQGLETRNLSSHLSGQMQIHVIHVRAHSNIYM